MINWELLCIINSQIIRMKIEELVWFAGTFLIEHLANLLVYVYNSR